MSKFANRSGGPTPTGPVMKKEAPSPVTEKKPNTTPSKEAAKPEQNQNKPGPKLPNRPDEKTPNRPSQPNNHSGPQKPQNQQQNSPRQGPPQQQNQRTGQGPNQNPSQENAQDQSRNNNQNQAQSQRPQAHQHQRQAPSQQNRGLDRSQDRGPRQNRNQGPRGDRDQGPRQNQPRERHGDFRRQDQNRAPSHSQEMDISSHDEFNERSFLTPLTSNIEKKTKFTGRCRLFVGNLPPETTEDDFKELFKPYGETSEVYMNGARNFGFIRLDTRQNAENAKSELDGQSSRGRTLRVRFATHGAAVRVKNLSPLVSNELLEHTFSMFGEIERCVVICDDRGKSTCEAIVEFVKKPAAQQALKRISEGVLLLTNNCRPILIEPLEQKDEEDGIADKYIPRNEQFKKERDFEPHFARPGSFEYDIGQRWKHLSEMELVNIEKAKRDMDEARQKLEDEIQMAAFEHEAEIIRQGLMRQQEELRKLEERRNQEAMRRQNERDMRRMEEDRMRAEEDRRRQEIMMRQDDMNSRRPQQDRGVRPGGVPVGAVPELMQSGIREGQRGNRGAPPLPPPPAPPMGIDRQGHQIPQGNMPGNFPTSQGAQGPAVSIGGPMTQESPNQQPGGPAGPGGQRGPAGNMGTPQGKMPEGGPQQMQQRGPSGDFGNNGFGPQGGMAPPQMGGGMNDNQQGIPGLFSNQGGMGPGPMNNGPGIHPEGNVMMERRRPGGPPRDDFGELKRMRHF